MAAPSSGLSGGCAAASWMLSHTKGRTLCSGSLMVRHWLAIISNRMTCLRLDSPDSRSRVQVAGQHKTIIDHVEIHAVALLVRCW